MYKILLLILLVLYGVYRTIVYTLFYYIPIQNGLSHYRGKLNYNIYKANGTIEYVEYSDKDFSLLIELYNKRENFISIPNVNFPKEKIDEVNLYVSHRMENHNDMTRFHRANRFLNEARKQSYLALKISNLIAFFECLFSIKNEDRIAHNISMRSSEFLFIYDKTILKDGTYKTLKSSYDIRSKYVHGDKLKDAHSKIIDLQLYSVNLDNLARIVYNTILDNNLEIFNDNTNIKAYLESVHK
ncbi:HEPN domain-containing protein [Chryseobacterium limigenitum]|uniref:Uncharacterized protein n=1 Tax=Chryseobacterium limigenitum TaxID=1612149 RepID=A0A1K2IVP1_9FLAO|nr:HEPN domain-containing protein [Chryseobacterium limigenitum]SFZ96431.1 hypothetical protein SAMN05216324_11972 [Chryseobacterium limigenitum]